MSQVVSSTDSLNWRQKLRSVLPGPILRPPAIALPRTIRDPKVVAHKLPTGPDEFGQCSVCGQFGRWIYERLPFPRLEELWGLPPHLFEALSRKESNYCPYCRTKYRGRRIASAVLLYYAAKDHKTQARSIVDWVEQPEARKLHIAEINRIDGLHGPLARLSQCAFSDYSDAAKPGEVIDGIRSEELTHLTYPDASFDIVLTSESLEHVPDLNATLREIYRVLVPGGRHIFTIPLMPGVPKTYSRAKLHRDGSVEHLAVPIKHPGGDQGDLVFTEFGADAPDLFRAAGFECDVLFGPMSEEDVNIVFVCTKPLHRA